MAAKSSVNFMLGLVLLACMLPDHGFALQKTSQESGKRVKSHEASQNGPLAR